MEIVLTLSKFELRVGKTIFILKKRTKMITVIKKGMAKEEINKKMDEAVAGTKKSSIRKYAGTLKSQIDPLAYQKQVRGEWE